MYGQEQKILENQASSLTIIFIEIFKAPKKQKSFSVILKLWKKEGKRSGIKFFENLNLDIAIFGLKRILIF